MAELSFASLSPKLYSRHPVNKCDNAAERKWYPFWRFAVWCASPYLGQKYTVRGEPRLLSDSPKVDHAQYIFCAKYFDIDWHWIRKNSHNKIFPGGVCSGAWRGTFPAACFRRNLGKSAGEKCKTCSWPRARRTKSSSATPSSWSEVSLVKSSKAATHSEQATGYTRIRLTNWKRNLSKKSSVIFNIHQKLRILRLYHLPGFDIENFFPFGFPVGKTAIFMPSDSEFPPEWSSIGFLKLTYILYRMLKVIAATCLTGQNRPRSA